MRPVSLSLSLSLSLSRGLLHRTGNLTTHTFRYLQIAARYLVIALAQIALGRVAQRWSTATDDTSGTAAHRASILDALRPWSDMPAPRIRKDNGRALFQLCAALASSSATPPCEPHNYPYTLSF